MDSRLTHENTPTSTYLGTERQQLHFSFIADIAELSPLTETIEEVGAQREWDTSVIMSLVLVLEELIVNIIHYGYPAGESGQIDVWCDIHHNDVCVRIEDSGIPFDPFSTPPPDLSLSIEERPIGGLGVHFVRKFMNSYTYCYEDGKNKVTLTKQLTVQ